MRHPRTCPVAPRPIPALPFPTRNSSLLLTAHTRLVVLLGDPVAHSRSPVLHNAAFAACGLDYAYLACRVAPADFPDALRGLRALGAAGANVTIPHKEAVVPLLDGLTGTAHGVGAVNTIYRDAGHLVGDNTDVGGFLDGLAPHADALQGAEMVVWGAGGAARAVVYALLTSLAPRRLTLVARRPEQAAALATQVAGLDPGGALAVVPFAEMEPAVRSARLLVNTTPLGMEGFADASPCPPHLLHAGQVVYDLVYQPPETPLLRAARLAGATSVNGLAMFHGQAARAFERWTGTAFPAHVFAEARKM